MRLIGANPTPAGGVVYGMVRDCGNMDRKQPTMAKAGSSHAGAASAPGGPLAWLEELKEYVS
jgi:hypothetical protein